jgi:hypothetical protein
MTLFFYFPPPRVNSAGLSRKEVIAQIDFVGGFLSIGGMVLFMAGMQWGGYQVSLSIQWPKLIFRLFLANRVFSIHGNQLMFLHL